jgi:deferrochelatase/peroxidase EfeB
MKGVTELTLLADIKPGLIEASDSRTYATRLRILLRTLFGIRKQGVEAALGLPFVGPLERLRSLHFVRWSIIDNQKLLLAVAFDGPWEPYIRRIADTAGPLLDVILCNCVDYDQHSTDKGYPKFAEWVRRYQIDAEFFFAGSADTTIDDTRYLRELEAKQSAATDPQAFDTDAARLRVGSPDAGRTVSLKDLAEKILPGLEVLYGLRDLYPDGSQDQVFLLRTVHLILHGLDPKKIPPPRPGTDDEDLGAKHARALAWFDSLVSAVPPIHPEPTTLPEQVIQGNILEGYGDMTHGCLLLLRFGEAAPAREFLRRLEPSTQASWQGDDVKLNVGLTYHGLERLGLSEEALRALPKEFREGMEARAGSLGDVGCNHPSRWTPPPTLKHDGSPGRPLRLSTVDLVIQLQTIADDSDDDHLWKPTHPLHARVQALLGIGGVHLLAVEPLRRKLIGGKVYEHFGYRDGISQPSHSAADDDPNQVPVGELLLGYPNDLGDDGKRDALLENGSFLVIRKLQQDVKRFKALIERAGAGPELAAKLMGRDEEGAALLAPGTPEDDNRFNFANDEDGDYCPLHSHIRRANPRTVRPTRSRAGTTEEPVPRIARRGFSYGRRFDEAPDDDERGLFFMAHNASIADQFEVIQRWISGGNSTGKLSANSDPLLGVPVPGQERFYRYVHNGVVKRVPLDPEPLVKLEWGTYLFVPSTEALAELAELPPEPIRNAPDIERGEQIIGLLDLAKSFPPLQPGERLEMRLQRVAGQWKALLEDPVAQQEAAPHVWAAIRNRGGVLDTPYGVLVGGVDHVMEVFKDSQTYSVREYWIRMKKSLGGLYLGMDPTPVQIEALPNGEIDDHTSRDEAYRAEVADGDHARLSAVPSDWIASIGQEAAFEAALNVTRSRLDALFGGRDAEIVRLRELMVGVLAGLSKHWFALPDGTHMKPGGEAVGDPNCPGDFVACARYIFTPNPTKYVASGANRGVGLRASAEAYVAQAIGDRAVPSQTLFEELVAKSSDPPDAEFIAQTLVGSAHGFVAPTGGSFVSVMLAWIKTESLWLLQQSLEWSRALADKSLFERAQLVMGEALERTMLASPVPSVLHRTAVKTTALGGVQIGRARRVVPSISSAACEAAERQREAASQSATQAGSEPFVEDPTQILFGGKFDRAGPYAHACPGREMALGVLLGMVTAILEYGTLTPVGLLSLRITRDPAPGSGAAPGG